jgi:hypothetical protein
MAGRGKNPRQTNPPIGKHAHRSERDWKESDASAAQFQVALPEMDGAQASAIVAQATPSQRQEEWRIDADVRRLHSLDESKQFIVVVGNRCLNLSPADHANTGRPSRRRSQIDPDEDGHHDHNENMID